MFRAFCDEIEVFRVNPVAANFSVQTIQIIINCIIWTFNYFHMTLSSLNCGNKQGNYSSTCIALT